MKKRIFTSTLLIVLLVSMYACSKKGSENTPPKNKFYVRVVEEGTDLPLEGAELINSFCGKYDNQFGCVQWDLTSTFTGPDGKLSALGRNCLLQKQGYWKYINRPDYPNFLFLGSTKYQPAHIVPYTSAGQTDSLLIKLFPITNILVRVRNTGAPTTAKLLCSAYVFGAYGNGVILRAGIDSSFQYPVFGNSENKIWIFRDLLSDSVNTQTRFIAKNENVNLDIVY